MKYHKDGTKPNNGEIFVFGSNLAGIHGAGAAREACVSYGAVMLTGVGLTGRSYAIPTKDFNIQTMPLDIIKLYVDAFLMYAKHVQDEEFFVTRIGCGLAGYNDSDIAPLFKGVSDNCSMPENWKQYLE